VQPLLFPKTALRFYLLIVSLLLFSACSTTPEKKTGNKTTWSSHKTTLNAIQKWQINGRFSVKTATENWTGSLTWRQEKQAYKINISGPLSTGSIQLEGDENLVQLRHSKNRFASDSNPQSLLHEHTGLTLPVNELRYWLRGIPYPPGTTSIMQFDKHGQLRRLKQNNWEIRFKRYTDVNIGTGTLQLPNKIFLVNQAFNVRLIIQQWQIFTNEQLSRP